MRLDPSRLYNRIGNMRLHWCKNVSYKEFWTSTCCTWVIDRDWSNCFK
jgi:hypothetical protein